MHLQTRSYGVVVQNVFQYIEYIILAMWHLQLFIRGTSEVKPATISLFVSFSLRW